MATFSCVRRALHTITVHKPMIKFPKRTALPEIEPLNELQAEVPRAKQAQVIAPVEPIIPQLNVTSPQSSMHFIIQDPIQQLKSTAIPFKKLPAKYKRALISQEEIEFIERGGPD